MLLGLVTSLVEYSLGNQLNVTAVGVATTGIVDKARGVVTTATDVSLVGRPSRIREELEHSLGLEVSVLNDVHAMAMAEGQLGQGKGVDDALYVAVGTGIGGAITFWRGYDWRTWWSCMALKRIRVSRTGCRWRTRRSRWPTLSIGWTGNSNNT